MGGNVWGVGGGPLALGGGDLTMMRWKRGGETIVMGLRGDYIFFKISNF